MKPIRYGILAIPFSQFDALFHFLGRLPKYGSTYKK